MSSLKLKDVEILFGTRPTPPGQYADVPHAEPVAAEGKRTTAFDVDLLEELRMSQLLIDDPHGFESEIITSHLSR